MDCHPKKHDILGHYKISAFKPWISGPASFDPIFRICLRCEARSVNDTVSLCSKKEALTTHVIA